MPCVRVSSAIDAYLQQVLAEEDFDALEDHERAGLQGPRSPPLQVSRRPLPIIALGQGSLFGCSFVVEGLGILSGFPITQSQTGSEFNSSNLVWVH